MTEIMLKATKDVFHGEPGSEFQSLTKDCLYELVLDAPEGLVVRADNGKLFAFPKDYFEPFDHDLTHLGT